MTAPEFFELGREPGAGRVDLGSTGPVGAQRAHSA
jgi:hypothetical protein